ncbi:MAG: peptidoglycan-binding domain-containing protein [Thiohalocapsa sp.]
MNDPKEIFVHCAATPPDLDIGAAEINQMHLRRGWSGIGYHAVVRLNGAEEIGRDPDGDGDATEHVGAHAYGYNRGSLAVVYVGGVKENNKPADTRTPEQRETLFAIVERWMKRFDIPIDSVRGHYEVDARKACPSFSMDEFRHQLRYRASLREGGSSHQVGYELDIAGLARLSALPLLRAGASSQAVGVAQALLRHAGHTEVLITGRFDEATVAGVEAFQRELGLDVDGAIGAGQTWPALIVCCPG